MAGYSGMILTKAGMQLQAQAQIGGELRITKIAVGDGMLANGESIENLTSLKNQVMTLGIQDMQVTDDGQSRIRALMTNDNLNAGFFVREVGVFAKIGDAGTETLYSYTNAGDKADYLPNKGLNIVEEVLEVYVIVGNAQNVTCIIDDRVTLATKLDIVEHNNDLNAHSEAIEKHNSNLNAHAGLLHLWQPTHVYAVGDICYSSTGVSYKRFECVVAGVSGAEEPTWIAIGQLVADGTVKWIVDDIRDGVSICNPIFDMILRPGYLKCNGSLISRAAYPRLTKFAIDNGLIVSEALWGGGAFGVGDGSTTIRLPDFRGEFIRGWDDGRGIDLGRSIRSTQTDENKSHYHDQVGWTGPSLVKTSSINNNTAPLLTNGDGGVLYSNQNGVNTSNNTSRILATWSSGGLESRPHNIALFAVIKY